MSYTLRAFDAVTGEIHEHPMTELEVMDFIAAAKGWHFDPVEGWGCQAPPPPPIAVATRDE